MRKYSYFYEGIYEKKLGIMRRGVALDLIVSAILLLSTFLAQTEDYEAERASSRQSRGKDVKMKDTIQLPSLFADVSSGTRSMQDRKKLLLSFQRLRCYDLS